MKYVNLLIKPASSLCNLRCRYCFYADVAANRQMHSYGIMRPDTMERLIQAAFDEVESNGTVSFAFQGGEPTLAGLLFFQAFLETEARYWKPGVQVLHSIQTNGMTLDEEWARFFSEHKFLVGISIDGDKGLHNLHRVDAAGEGTWSRVLKALRLLRQYHVETNILCVVSGGCARSPQRVYASLKKLQARYLQFIPCLDPLDAERGSLPHSLHPGEYGAFLCGLFDVWYSDWKAGQYISIRMFDDYVHLFMGLPAGTCATWGQCGTYFVAEGDGSLYPCDFYVLDQWRLGSVHDDVPLGEIARNETAKAFREQSRIKPAGCSDCPWFHYCNGGCRRDWHAAGGEVRNYFCSSFQTFFRYAAPRLREIAMAERAMGSPVR